MPHNLLFCQLFFHTQRRGESSLCVCARLPAFVPVTTNELIQACGFMSAYIFVCLNDFILLLMWLFFFNFFKYLNTQCLNFFFFAFSCRLHSRAVVKQHEFIYYLLFALFYCFQCCCCCFSTSLYFVCSLNNSLLHKTSKQKKKTFESVSFIMRLMKKTLWQGQHNIEIKIEREIN